MAIVDYDHLMEDANPEPETCTWPKEDRVDSPLCGHRALAVYVGFHEARYPRCSAHDGTAVRAQAARDGFVRIDLTPAKPQPTADSWAGWASDAG
jgi:hypothetical protein